jgi:hypothetical protein
VLTPNQVLWIRFQVFTGSPIHPPLGALRIERLRTQHTEAVRDKSAAENKSHNLLEKLLAAKAEKKDLGRRLAAEKENTDRARAEAQAARDRAHTEA